MQFFNFYMMSVILSKPCSSNSHSNDYHDSNLASRAGNILLEEGALPLHTPYLYLFLQEQETLLFFFFFLTTTTTVRLFNVVAHDFSRVRGLCMRVRHRINVSRESELLLLFLVGERRV